MSEKPMQATKNDLMQSALDHYDELATKANHWMSDIPKAIRAYYSEPNQPAPKSAEEVLTEFNLDDSIYRNVIIKAMQSYASQSAPRYVTDEEIDAMWPHNSDADYEMLFTESQREAAKAMRDMIFSHRSA